MLIVSVLKYNLNVPALNYVTSLGICYQVLRLAKVVRRSCRRHVGTKYTLRRLVVWSTVISTYLPGLPLHALFFPPISLKMLWSTVDVASTSGARVSGAHENVPQRVVDDR